MRYRADVDGLRAVAVSSVVLFHAEIGSVTGGYVGVDVFFVISGYLITRILLNEMREGSFSLANFYERRIRRIFPALFVMIGACFIIAYLLMMPQDFSDFAKSAVAAALSASNLLFWWQAGYFDGAAEAKPLLHTWSLAVEEQFYFIFPLLLLALFRWVPRALTRWLIGLSIFSFGLSVGSLWFPLSGFYLAPFRAWELLIGSLLAARVFPSSTQEARDLISIAGLAAIFVAVFLYDAQTPFPGYAALLPVLGSAAIIYAGEDGHSAGGRWLGSKPLVAIGLISYSLYLWHWPALVFAKYYAIDELNTLQSVSAISCAFVFAYISWRYVERPFRKANRFFPRRSAVFLGATGAICGSLLAAAFVLSSGGAPARFPIEVRRVLASAESHTERMSECSGRLDRQFNPKGPCTIGSSGHPTAIIWGDSHADALTGALQQISDKKGIAFYYAADSSCPPLLGVGPDETCIQSNEQRMDFLKSNPDVRTVILAARWTSYMKGRAVDFGPAESNSDLPQLMTAGGHYLPKFSKELEQEFSAGLHRTVRELLSAGKKVVVVYPVPETGYNIPTTLARKLIKGESPESFTRPESYYLKRHDFTLKMLDALPYGPYLLAADPRSRLCDGRRCLVFAHNRALYWDDDHLSIEGATYISPLFDCISDRVPEQERWEAVGRSCDR